MSIPPNAIQAALANIRNLDGNLQDRTAGVNSQLRDAFTQTTQSAARLAAFNQEVRDNLKAQTDQIKAQAEAAEAEVERLQFIDSTARTELGGAQQAAFSNLREQDRKSLNDRAEAGDVQAIALKSYFQERELQSRKEAVLEAGYRLDPTDPKVQDRQKALNERLDAVDLAMSRNRELRRTQVSDEQYQQLANQGQFQEQYANRDGAGFGSLGTDQARNVIASAGRGIGGLQSAIQAALGFEDASQRTQQSTQAFSDFVDVQTPQAAIQNAAVGEAVGQGDVFGALGSLGGASVLGLGENVLGAIGSGLGIGTAARGVANLAARVPGVAAGSSALANAATAAAPGAAALAAQAGRLAPINLGIQGQSFQGNALDPGEGRQAQALTQLAGAGALSAAGAAFPLLSGLEGAIGTRGVRALQGADTGSRAGNTALGTLRGAATEAVQEGAEAIIEQGARGVGTGEGFVDAINPGSVLAQSALGGAIGGPIGAGAGLFQSVAPGTTRTNDNGVVTLNGVTQPYQPDGPTVINPGPQTFDPAAPNVPQTASAANLFTDSAYYGPVNRRPALDLSNVVETQNATRPNTNGGQATGNGPIPPNPGNDSGSVQTDGQPPGTPPGSGPGSAGGVFDTGGALDVAGPTPASGTGTAGTAGNVGANKNEQGVPSVTDRGQPVPVTRDAGGASVSELAGRDATGIGASAPDPTANLDDDAFDGTDNLGTAGTSVPPGAGGGGSNSAAIVNNGSASGDGGGAGGAQTANVSDTSSARPQLSRATGRNGRSSRFIEGFNLEFRKRRKSDGELIANMSRRGDAVLINEAGEEIFSVPGVEKLNDVVEAFNKGTGVTPQVLQAVEEARQSSLGESAPAGVNAEPTLETLEQVNAAVEAAAMGQSLNEQGQVPGVSRPEDTGGAVPTGTAANATTAEPASGPQVPDNPPTRSGADNVRSAPNANDRIRGRNVAFALRRSSDISESFPEPQSEGASARGVDYNEREIRRDIIRLVQPGPGGLGFDVVNPDTISPELDARIEADTGSRFADNSGVIYRDQILINPERIRDSADLEVVLAHEILGHAGLRARYGPYLDRFLNYLYRDLGGVDGVVARAESLGINIRDGYANLVQQAQASNRDVVGRGEAQRAITEELIAGIAEQGGLSIPQMKILQTMGAAIRQWMRRHTPGVARLFNAQQVADWELAVFAAEASKAGRALVDRGQHIDTVRAFAARPYATRNGMADRIRSYENKPQELKDSYDRLFNSGDILGEVKSFSARTRQRLAEARTNDDNWWNKFKNEIVNNRNGLQNAFIKSRRNWSVDRATENKVFGGADASIAKASTSSRIRKEDRGNASILQAGLNFALTKGFTIPKSGRVQHLKEILNLSDTVTLKESRAGGLYTRAMQVVEGRLESSLNMLEMALKKSDPRGSRVSRGEAYDTANEFVRASHAIERNRRFFFHPDKNGPMLKKIVGREKFKQLRALYNQQFTDGQSPTNLADQVEAFVMRSLTPTGRVELAEELPNIRTIGLTTAEARHILDDIGVTPELDNYDQGLHEALLTVNEHLQTINQIADRAQREAGMGSVLLDRAIDYNNFEFYFPHYEATGNDAALKGGTDYMSAARYADKFMTEIGVARGSEKIGAVPLVAVRHQAERKFADIGDNDVSQNVLMLWAASQGSSEFRQVFEDKWGDAEVSIINKNTRDEKGKNEWLKVAGTHDGKTFMYHLPPGLNLPDRVIKGSPGDSGQYVAVIKFPEDSRIPSLVKGRRTNEAVIRDLRENHPTLYNGTRGSARVIGSMHTRYNFLNYPLKALVRDGIQAFATIGAAEGSAGLKAFMFEGTTAAMRDGKKIGEYMWVRSQTGEKPAARLAEMRKDPQLRDFVEFIDSGAFIANPRSFSLEGRHDELVRGLTNGRTLTGTERGRLAEADQAISLLSIMADVMGRYAMFKAQRMLGKSVTEAAVEAKNLANFEQRGQNAYADIGSMLYVFFRPSLVSLTQIVDTALDSQYNLEAAGVALGLSGALFAFGAMMSPEDENGRNKFIHQGSDPANFKLFIGDSLGLALPFGYNGFSAITAMGMQAWFGMYSEQTPVSTLNNMFDVLTSNLSPVTNNIPVTDNGRFSLRNATIKAFDLVFPTVPGVLLGLGFNMTNFGAPIVRDYGTGASSVGKVFDSNSSQIGGFSETLTRRLFDDLGFEIPLGQLDYLFGELASGPRNVINAAFEAYRAVTGSDTPVNMKRLSLGVGGLLASPYNPQVGTYWDTRAKANDAIESEKFMREAGYTEQDIALRMRRQIGDGGYQRLIEFKELDDNSNLSSLMREARSIRATRSLSGEERIEALRINRTAAEREISLVFAELNR